MPDARTAAASFFLVSRIWASMRRRSSEELGGELAAGRGDGPGRRDRFQDAGGLSCGDLLGDAAGDQLAQHGVQPAGDLGAGPAQVPVALGPHLQHRRVVVGLRPPAGPASAAPRWPPTGRRWGRSCSSSPAASSRTRAPSLGCTSSTRSPAATQLLGQQVAQPAGALDRPGPLRPGRRPRQQPLGLGRRGAHPQLAQRLLGRADRHRRVRALVRVDPDHHCHHQRLLLLERREGPWRACLISDLLASRLFRATPRQGPDGWHVVIKPDRKRPAGGSRASPSDL